MTKEKANEWLKQVAGRKIRPKGYLKKYHSIPTGEWKTTSYSDPYHWTFWVIDQDGNKDWYYVSEGFEKDEDGYQWELVEEPIVGYIRKLLR